MKIDQAENLRKQIASAQSGRKTKVVSIVSGKGGVGKTNISINLAIGLSQIGKKVLLVDLDIGMANIDIVAGVSAQATIVDMIEEKLSIYDIMADGPAGISIIAGGSGLSFLFQLNAIKFSYFLRQIEQLEHQFDYILFDMGAGIAKDSMSFILSSHEAILVLTPEPTSITDGYALVKALHTEDARLPIYTIVNACENEDEGYETAIRFKRAAHDFLGKEVTMIGALPFDRTVSRAVREQVPFLLSAPKSKVSLSMKKIIFTYSGQEIKTKKEFGNFLTKLTKLLTPMLKRGSNNGE